MRFITYLLHYLIALLLSLTLLMHLDDHCTIVILLHSAVIDVTDAPWWLLHHRYLRGIALLAAIVAVTDIPWLLMHFDGCCNILTHEVLHAATIDVADALWWLLQHPYPWSIALLQSSTLLMHFDGYCNILAHEVSRCCNHRRCWCTLMVVATS